MIKGCFYIALICFIIVCIIISEVIYYYRRKKFIEEYQSCRVEYFIHRVDCYESGFIITFIFSFIVLLICAMIDTWYHTI
jgi:hypothetical protein